MAIRVDEVGIDGAPAAVAEDPRSLPPQRTGSQQLELVHELDEVGVGGIVVLSRCNEVVLHQLCNVGDRVGHDCNSCPFWVHGCRRTRRGSRGLREWNAVPREYPSEAAARTALTPCGSVQS